ncbi:MAG: potassium-transporting ATPase subunit KdpC [Rickettsiales bacterium]
MINSNRKSLNLKNIASGAFSSLRLLLVLTFLVGVIYPLSVTVIAKVVFPEQASGGLIVRDGKVIGSKLLGQTFTEDKYFWGRLSANNYDAVSSGGSNLSIANPKLLEIVNARVEQLKKADPDNQEKIPVDLVTASASGLDPHISLDAAHYHVGRIAKARGIKPEELNEIINKHIDWQSKLNEEPYVNVLELNLALETESEKARSRED